VVAVGQVRARKASDKIFVEVTVAVSRLLPLDRVATIKDMVAIEIRRQLEGAEPTVTDADLVLGLCYEQLGAADQQYATYRRAASTDPLSVPATYGMARALTAMGKLEDAIEVYRSLVAKVPTFRVTVARLLLLRNLGQPRGQRRWEELDRLLAEAEKADPKSTEILLLRAEALAGFGTPVAVTSVMLIALGFQPLKAAVLALTANTAPVAFGAMAVPIITLSQVSGLPLNQVASMVGRQTPLLAVFVPLVLVFIVDGRRGLREAWVPAPGSTVFVPRLKGRFKVRGSQALLLPCCRC